MEHFAKYSLSPTPETLGELSFNENQLKMTGTIAAILYDSGLDNILRTTGSNILLANNHLKSSFDIESAPLPSDQWVSELQHLQTVSMAKLQRSAFIIRAGPSDPEILKYSIVLPPDSWSCANQKFRDDSYESFSVLGIALIFGIGGALIITGTLITFVIPIIQKRTGKGDYRRLQWYSNDMLHLQRIAFEIEVLEHGLTMSPVTLGTSLSQKLGRFLRLSQTLAH